MATRALSRLRLAPRRAAAVCPPRRPLSTPPAAPAPATDLLPVLQDTIRTHGPLPVATYMTLCLAHPTLGYYSAKEAVFGARGDFVTSPEISQVFGELLALWFVLEWQAQGSPPKVRLVELGPGRGTLLVDVLRTFRALPPPSRPPVTSLHLVEASPLLRETQRARLASDGWGDLEAHWWDGVAELPPAEEDEFTIVVAHEFFDALPIHVLENTPKGWREVVVEIADPAPSPPSLLVGQKKPPPPLRLVLAPNPTPASTMYTHLLTGGGGGGGQSASPARELANALDFDTTLPLSSSGPPASNAHPAPNSGSKSTSSHPSRSPTSLLGSRVEISPASWAAASSLASLFSSPRGGAGLIVDYGDTRSFGSSWRGFRKHEVVDPLSEPGKTDLTANVDFRALGEAMGDAVTLHGPLPQSTFLTSLGLQPRLASLLAAAPTAERRKELSSAAQRLVDVGGMGCQYKVLGVTGSQRRRGESWPFLDNGKGEKVK